MPSHIAPYGSWKSLITADLIVSGSIGLGQIMIDRDDVYWLEVRPSEAGRSVIVKRSPGGSPVDITPAGFNSRTRVHEYGGGDYTVWEGTVFFSNFADQQVYSARAQARPEPITFSPGQRYADFEIDKLRNRLFCIREDHSGTGREPVNTIVALNSSGNGEESCLVQGHDFYSSPRLSPDGTRLAWLAWSHPNMPWDGCELWVAQVLPGGDLKAAEHVAGGSSESIFQPQWSPHGILHFISDRSGWWNLYRHRDNHGVECLLRAAFEFGMPQWVFGMSTYAFLASERIVAAYLDCGISKLGIVEPDGSLRNIPTPFVEITSVKSASGHIFLRGGSAANPPVIARLNDRGDVGEILRRGSEIVIESGYLSPPHPISFPTQESRDAYAFFYPPSNADYSAPTGTSPPLLVKSHGGPTAATTASLRLEIRYWTSRGIAVLDVNYGGSTGYGRLYRERLDAKWGLVDVEDCINGARYLVEKGWVDGRKCVIDGGSAGGYTTLCALTFHDFFSAGASYYGVSDLRAMTTDTHKFESRYLDRLVAPYPEWARIYDERSPINFVERISCPVIFFQGLEDKVVPPSQTEMMVSALREKRMPVAYVAFTGEQHGFRRAESIKRSLESELFFYSRVLGFEAADQLETVVIENLNE